MSTRIVTRVQLVQELGVTHEFLALLNREHIVCCDGSGCYAVAQIEEIRVCWTLHHDLEVNPAGIEVALTLLGRLHEERRRAQALLGQAR